MKKTVQITHKEVIYYSKGVVIGRAWGGGICAYNARKYTAPTKKELYNKIIEGIEDDSIDAGFGFEKVKGGKFLITKRTNITIDDRIYTNKVMHYKIFGNLSPKEKRVLNKIELID